MYLGIDLGTSGVKALLIGEDQGVVASGTSSLDVSRPADGWSEQDPLAWIAATKAAVAEVRAKLPLDGVKGIGLSGHMHGATLLDASDDIVRPCMLWNDTRSHREAASLDDDPQFQEITGNIVFPGFTAPKMEWVRLHEPDNFSKTARILLPKDFLRLWLTGEHVSEMSDAAGTAWLDTGARDWSDALLARTHLSRKHMPRLVEGSAVSAQLRSSVAAELGLSQGIPVAGGAGDNAASAVGVGVTTPGEAFLSLGTSGVLFAAGDGYAPDPETALHTFCHALPGRWHQMGVILAASDALSWYSRLVGEHSAALTDELDQLEAPGKTLFLPYLGGERTPHNDAQVRGSFLGLEHATNRQAATRAVLEGVAFAFRDSLQAMKATGTQLETVLAVGGGSNSEYWLRVLATALNLPISVPEDGDFGAAFGAARLGLMAARNAGEEIATTPEITRVIEPDPSLTAAFTETYARYRAAYTLTKEIT